MGCRKINVYKWRGEDDKFLPEGKKKRSEVTNSNAYRVQAINISSENRLVRDKMRGEWVVLTCLF